MIRFVGLPPLRAGTSPPKIAIVRRNAMSSTAELARPMTFEDFVAFVEERPDGERWELVNGVPFLNAWPTDVHQVIVGNINTLLLNHKNAHDSPWIPLSGHTVPAPSSDRDRS
jgi:hypothetical protein